MIHPSYFLILTCLLHRRFCRVLMSEIVMADGAKKTSSLSHDLTQIDPLRALSFFRIVGQLKTLKRTGWVNNNIVLPESVADHMYRMSMMSFMITDPSVNKDKLMKICLVHDLAESIVGDITPHQDISKDEKRRMEEKALRSIVSDIDNEDVGNEILGLWLEYEDGESKEACLARQLDKLEMIVQADEYERVGVEEKGSAEINLEEFFTSTKHSFSHPEVVSWATALLSDRKERLAKRRKVAVDENEDLSVSK